MSKLITEYQQTGAEITEETLILTEQVVTESESEESEKSEE